jgi:hypothetical protein
MDNIYKFNIVKNGISIPVEITIQNLPPVSDTTIKIYPEVALNNPNKIIGQCLISDANFLESISISGEGAENFEINNSCDILISDTSKINQNTNAEYNLTISATNELYETDLAKLNIIFHNTAQLAKFQSHDTSSRDNFGRSVAIYGNYIVVGAEHEDTGGENAGAAYLFKIGSNGSVTELAKFQGHDTSSRDYFGGSVAIYGNYIVVGVKYEDTGGDNAGAVYLFRK